MTDTLNIAQVGVGYWGRNLLRNFAANPRVRVLTVCEARADRREEVAATHAGVRVTARFEDVLTSPDVEAVVLAVDTPQHHEFALAALRAGKHVFVEKPMARSAVEARELVAEAEAHDLTLMVGHLLLFHPAFCYVEELIRAGELGDVHYLYARRVNLGIIRTLENAFESLAPHDLSVALTFLDGTPVAVSAQGQSYIQPGVEDVAFATVYFDNGQMAHLHTSWLDPQKVRNVTIVGSKRMAVIDDVSASEKVRLYDKGIELGPGDPRYVDYAEAPMVRDGDILVPHIQAAEPLRLECAHFVECVLTGARPKSDGRHGLAVVQIMDAARRSIKEKGTCVEIQSI